MRWDEKLVERQQNENRLTDKENRLVVARGGGDLRDGKKGNGLRSTSNNIVMGCTVQHGKFHQQHCNSYAWGQEST